MFEYYELIPKFPEVIKREKFLNKKVTKYLYNIYPYNAIISMGTSCL